MLIVISGEEEKLKMPLNFSKTQTEAGNEIRIILWGPSERTIANNETLKESYKSLGGIKPKACVNSAKAQGIVEKLSKDFELIPVGEYIAKSIGEGYVTITF
ncbi:MAG: hypothetical protein OH316_02185 [Candidatus Parvarchaeota archaeon]|nr:hypothetical protein [Candidatus Parvarchaeota archaeon]